MVEVFGVTTPLYKKGIIKYVGSILGNVVKIDYNTKMQGRGQFARMAVEIDLKKTYDSGNHYKLSLSAH